MYYAQLVFALSIFLLSVADAGMLLILIAVLNTMLARCMVVVLVVLWFLILTPSTQELVGRERGNFFLHVQGRGIRAIVLSTVSLKTTVFLKVTCYVPNFYPE